MEPKHLIAFCVIINFDGDFSCTMFKYKKKNNMRGGGLTHAIYRTLDLAWQLLILLIDDDDFY
ncbi:hypothetical protein AVM72_14680 [Piscirickettsia salmonis]|nr:hypothetical protein PSLF89_03860 [Piscirickettsia salmonis LF-89 = ATCC VR-1361]ALY01736.1 hypothetical protein AWE47_01685 [Piscirickettsia salmonis]AMA41252.1 hypothetical protein AWJ11_01695 [Piscirickettsia salmonis]AOS36446.1 hypothetical protein AVM72_14680 [Piscirickettsia salmonis]APS64369.1 hypothetical protein AVI54_11620 [Piscirickettsia salmonis]